MAFDEVRLPTEYSFGAAGGPGFNTYVGVGDSGHEQRVAHWAHGRIRYDLNYDVQDPDSWAALLAFYRARQGAARGFRFKDWSDFTTASDGVSTPAFDDVQIGVGDGSTTTFQLRKQYVSGGRTINRTITKPVSGTVLIGVNGSSVGSGWSVDTTTGIVTFTAAPSATHPITWGGEFDVPVRFAETIDDLLAVRLDGFQIGSVGLEVVELLDPSALGDEPATGGAASLGDIGGVDTAIYPSTGRVIEMAPTSATNLILPAMTGLPLGGPWFYLVNSGSDTVTVKEAAADGGATVGTIGAGVTRQVLLLTGPAWSLL